VNERTGSILDSAYYKPRQGDQGASWSERDRASGSLPGEDG
jgi:hypothetical protein